MLETLRRLVQEVNSAQNLTEALAIIVARVKQVMAADVCSVYLTDPATEDRVLMATEGLNPDAVGQVRLGRDEGLIGLVSDRAEPVNLRNAPDHPRYKYFPETGEERYHGFLGVPIIHHRRVLGVLVVQHLQERQFAEDEVTLLVTVAAQLAGAIAHAQANGGIDGLKEKSRNSGDRPLRGLPGAPGVALGRAVVIYPPAELEVIPNRAVGDTEKECERFLAAVENVRSEVKQLSARVANLPAADRALFDAYLLMLNSDSILTNTLGYIRAGNWAPGALRDTINEHARVFANMEDSYLSERAQDIRDLGRRILVHLQATEHDQREYPEKTILVGDELSASALVEVPPDRLKAVISTQGSGSSHVAILARALGIPAVMGAADLPTGKVDGQEMVVDGYQGCAYVKPSVTVRNEYRRLMREEAELSAGLEELRDEPAATVDGFRISLYANTGLLSDITSALDGGAEGIGLYRTEFPFMIRDRFPGEEEQTNLYRQILEGYAPKPVTLRTLDIGGDKTLSYFPIKEDNPFLGWRGVRISLDHPDIFLVQLRAMLRASEGLDNLRILLPMISTVAEVEEALELINRAHQELAGDGLRVNLPKVGAMIEVPSAVYQAGSIARRVDFLSIGTNDLVQYLLAVDRNNSNVAGLYDSLHPAVICAVEQVVRSSMAFGKPVSVCGEMAGDPASAVLLVGMGLNSLSMSAVNLPRIKWVIRNFSMARSKELLEEVKQFETAHAVRQRLNEELEKAGLGGLLRAGK